MEEENNATPCHRSSSKVIKDTSESDVRDIGSKGCLPFFGAKALKATLAIHAQILLSLMHFCYYFRYCNPIQRARPAIHRRNFDFQQQSCWYVLEPITWVAIELEMLSYIGLKRCIGIGKKSNTFMFVSSSDSVYFANWYIFVESIFSIWFCFSLSKSGRGTNRNTY